MTKIIHFILILKFYIKYFVDFRYRILNQSIVSSLQSHFNLCSLELHYPEPIQLETAEKFKIVRNGILSKTQRSNIVAGLFFDSQWQLETFNDALSHFEATANRKKYLLFDLDGDEIEVMDSIVDDCNALKKYRQISFRLRFALFQM